MSRWRNNAAAAAAAEQAWRLGALAAVEATLRRALRAWYASRAAWHTAALFRQRGADVRCVRAICAWRRTATAYRVTPTAARALATRRRHRRMRCAARAWMRLVAARSVRAWGVLLCARALRARCSLALAQWVALAQGVGGGARPLERLLKRRRHIGREDACASSMASSSERLQQLQARYGVPLQLYGSVGYLPGIV